MLRTAKVPLQWTVRLILIAALISSVLVVVAPSGTASASRPTPTVVLVPRGDLGLVLSDPDGWTLYTWDGDMEGVSNCYDACAAAWPPYTITGDLIAPDDLPGSLGLIDRGDGTWQVTIDNWPLYYFAFDNQPGDVNGNGSMGFGAQWYAMAYTPPAPEEPTVVTVPVPVVPSQPAPTQPAPPVATAPPVVAMPPAMPAPARQTVQVAINDFDYRPPTVNIQVGDTVNWTNNGRAPHTVTSDTGAFDSGRLNAGQSFSYTFNAPGTFPYHCAIHPNMRGTVVVSSGGAPVAGQQPFQPNFGPPAVDTSPFFGTPPYPGAGQPLPPYDANPYDNYPPLPYPPVGNPPGPTYNQLFSATAPPNGAILVTWVPMPNATAYRIYNTTSQIPSNLTVVSTVNQSPGAPVTQATVGGLAPGTTYLFQVRAVDSNGLETMVPASSPQAGPGGPTQPSGPLSVSSTTSNSVTLTWSALPGASNYRVLQGSSPGGPFIVSTAGTVPGTSATVTGLSPNTTYYFQVVPLDQVGNPGPPTNTVSANTSVSLAAPANLALVTATGTSAMLTWGASPGATAYRVMQSQLPAGPFVTVNPTSLTTTGATVGNLTPNTTYYFQVVALDGSGNQSPPSNTLTVITPAP